MQLTRIEVKNFRSFAEPVDVPLSEGMNVITGVNNAGKSNLLKAVRMALDAEYDFAAGRDVPAQRLFAFPRVTLTFESSRSTSPERTFLRNLDAYERSAGVGQTYSEVGIARLVVTYTGQRQTGLIRQEFFAVRGAGNRRGENALNERALRQFKKIVRLVAVESGQSVQDLLNGKFREILHSTLNETMHESLLQSAQARETYVERLETNLLAPMKDRLQEISARLFPEIQTIRLVPSVSSIEDSLSTVDIQLRDAIETNLSQKGTGVAGGVLIALLRYLADSTKQSLVLAIEEPEAFLHPAAQEELRDDLEALAERKSVSLLMTTHSPFVISRSSRAQVVSVEKSADGVSQLGAIAGGDDAHANVIGSLFRDPAIPDLLDRQLEIPTAARAILLVEGETDRQFLILAMRLAGYSRRLSGLLILPQRGTDSLVVKALILRAEQPRPVWALLDSDAPGRNARDMLRKRFGFPKDSVIEYGSYLGNLENAESEWLFPQELMQRFVDQYGEESVLKSKDLIAGEYRYDFLPKGKSLFPEWLEGESAEGDVARWLPILEDLLGRLDRLPAVIEQPSPAVPTSTSHSE
jgi:predicted ATP-dependent endonuclease of OLD family